MIASTALIGGCGSQSGNKDASNGSNSGSSVSAVAGKFPYQSIDVKQFDKTKFDGKIRISETNTESPRNNKIIGTFNTPLSYDELEKADVKKLGTDTDVKELANGLAGVELGSYGGDSELYIGTVLDIPVDDNDVNDHMLQYDILMDTLGVPSTILVKVSQYAASGLVFLTYVYQYDDCVLEFDINETDGVHSKFSEITEIRCVTPEEYQNELDIYAKSDNPIESVIK